MTLQLYTAGTVNGYAISIFLEELKASGQLPDDYEIIKMSLSDGDKGKVHNHVKAPWFLEINPNGRIPTITHNGFHVFETSAILLYLAEKFDKRREFSFDSKVASNASSEVLQWLFFVHGGLSPMQGQANYFIFSSPHRECVRF